MRTAPDRRKGTIQDLFIVTDGRCLRLLVPLPACKALTFHPSPYNRGACMKCVLFYHALPSCWNNGNAHFLRGVARELRECGHQVVVYEPAEGWSRLNAIRDGGMEPLQEALALLPGIDI